jgi:hypothetical protein
VSDGATLVSASQRITISDPALDKRNTLFNEVYTKLEAFTATNQVFDGLIMKRLVNPEDRVEPNTIGVRMSEVPVEIDGQMIFDGLVVSVLIPVSKDKTISIGGTYYSGKQLATYYKEQIESIADTWRPGKITSVNMIRGAQVVKEVFGDLFGDDNEQVTGCQVDILFQWPR